MNPVRVGTVEILMSEDAFAEGSPGQRVRVVEGKVAR
jgi:hypothetical protein